MSPQELQALHKRKPFEPFTITTSDGRTFAVTAPTQMMVGLRDTVVGIPGPTGENHSFAILSNQHIVRAEPDDTTPHIVPSA